VDKAQRLLDDLQQLQDAFIARAVGESYNEREFTERRARLLKDPLVAPQLPDFVRRCRTLDQFWGIIQPMFPTYRERRKYIWDEFRPIMDKAESGLTSPVHGSVSEVLDKLNADHVRLLWDKAQARAIDDADGALTAARALLESVCKLMLDGLGETYDDSAELPKLFRAIAKRLNLAPEQHTEQVFKQILGGCTSVVEGLGALRNKMGDAHGKNARAVRPATRHAELAVNLAGSMAIYLVATFEARGRTPLEGKA
jgi:Abortive infection C-terminus